MRNNMKQKYLWLLSVDTDDPYEDWTSPVGVFPSLEAANAFIENNPIEVDEEDGLTYIYLTPEKVLMYG